MILLGLFIWALATNHVGVAFVLAMHYVLDHKS